MGFNLGSLVSSIGGGYGLLGGAISGIKSPFHASKVSAKPAPYQSGSPYDANAPQWDASGMPVGQMPRGDYALDYQYEANRRAEQRRQALWGDAHGALQQGTNLLQMYRPGGASALASGIYNQQASLYGTQALNTVAPDMLIGWREDQRQQALAEEQNRYNQSQANFKAGMLLQAAMPLAGGIPQPGGEASTGSNQVGSGANSYGQPTPSGAGGTITSQGGVPQVQGYGSSEVPGALPSILGEGGASGGAAQGAASGAPAAAAGGTAGGAAGGALGAILGAVTGGIGGAAAGGASGGALGGASTGAAASGAAGGAAAGAGAGSAGGAAGGAGAGAASGLGSGIGGGNVGLTSFSGADVAQAAGRIAPIGQNSAILNYSGHPYSQELTRMMQDSAFQRLSAAARSRLNWNDLSGENGDYLRGALTTDYRNARPNGQRIFAR